MIPYWSLFAYFAAGSFFNANSKLAAHQRSYPLLVVGALLIAAFIGLRYEVGADWRSYEFMFWFAGETDLSDLVAIGDPGYQFLNWGVHQFGFDIWAVNLICGLIFSWGLMRFARSQPDPWLAVLVAIPYLVIVVAMGYSRQGVAIGILLAGLGRLERGGSTLRFAGYVIVAALFHRTAVVALPLVVFASDRNKLLNVLVGLALCVLVYDVFLSSEVDRFVEDYIETEYASQGAAIRVMMSVIPASVFLFNQRALGFPERQRKIWLNFSLAAFGLLVLLFVLPSSTAVDRLALYILPLQVAILPRAALPFFSRGVSTSFVVVYSALVLFVWLNFSEHAQYWLPYEVYPFG